MRNFKIEFIGRDSDTGCAEGFAQLLACRVWICAHAEEHGHCVCHRHSADPIVALAPGDQRRHFESCSGRDLAAQSRHELPIIGALGSASVEIDLQGSNGPAASDTRDFVRDTSDTRQITAVRLDANNGNERGPVWNPKRLQARTSMDRPAGERQRFGKIRNPSGARDNVGQIFRPLPCPEDDSRKTREWINEAAAGI